MAWNTGSYGALSANGRKLVVGSETKTEPTHDSRDQDLNGNKKAMPALASYTLDLMWS